MLNKSVFDFQMGSYFLGGRLFVRDRAPFALRPRLYFNGEDCTARLVLRAGRLQFPCVQLDDFGPEPLIEKRFIDGVVSCIPEHFLSEDVQGLVYGIYVLIESDF